MSPAPVQPHERINYLDVVRGIAITGVLIAYVFWNLGNAPATTYSGFENYLNQSLGFLVDSKCYTLLATLFAIGFVLHMSKGGDEAKRLYTYRRRLVGLIVIGLIHAVALRNGDILLPYAIIMMLVTFCYRWSTRALVAATVGAYLLVPLAPQLWRLAGLAFPSRPGTGSGNIDWVIYWYKTAPIFWESTLFLLIMGLLVGRLFITEKRKLTNRQLQIIALAGLSLGSLSFWIVNYHNGFILKLPDIGKTFILRSIVMSVFFEAHKLGLASAYASTIYLVLQRFPLKLFATLGRTSLSNYILQAVIVVPLCLLFNLYDQMKPGLALFLSASIWVVQVVLSTWWLKHHRFGPLEWVLRSFTYGKAEINRKLQPEPLIAEQGVTKIITPVEDKNLA